MNAIAEYAPGDTAISSSLNRVRAEYREMPGLSLTQAQMQRLFGFDARICATLIDRLVSEGILHRTSAGCYIGH